MIAFSRIHAWFAVAISAALIGAAGSIAYERPSALAGRAPATDSAYSAVRAQADDQPDVQQVDEGDAADQEALDEGAPPAQDAEDV